MLYAKNKQLGNLGVLGLVAVGMYFAFYALDPNVTLSEQWATYINPFNNFFLYACGLALYYNFHDISMKSFANILIVISLAVLCFYPVAGDQINITTGINRVVFALASIVLTLGFYKFEIDLPNWFAKPFANLGEATYGVYLLHPIVFYATNKLFLNPYVCIGVTVVTTIIAANLSYHFYEKKFIKIGKKVTTIEHRVYESAS